MELFRIYGDKWPKLGAPGHGLLGRDGITGEAQCDKSQGDCSVSFFGSGIDLTNPNYQVIDTDYDNYTMVYSCESFINKEVLDLI